MEVNRLEQNKKDVFVSREKLDEQKRYVEKLREITAGRKLTAYVRTYGCQQNVSDSEKLKGILESAGYILTDSPKSADLALFNTCAIRENAEERVFGNVGALKKEKRANPDMIIGVCGCMTQQEHIARRFKEHFPYVDLVFGTHALYKLPQLLYEKLSGAKQVYDIKNCDGEIAEELPIKRESGKKANLPIMYGCNNFCTYCVVPYVRGRERSRDDGVIIDEAKRLIQSGYKEITLLGQNVNSYKSPGNKTRFPLLLRALNDLDGEFIIRFMTSHPKDCTKELIDAIAECDKVSKHLHLPVQSGSDRILKLMNRHYDSEKYLKLVDYAKSRIDSLALTSDIIVGFPGETKEDFEKTLELVERVRFHSLFTFIFSPRVGTKAANMPDPTPKELKSEWFTRLLSLQEKIGDEIYESYVGKTERVFIDGEAKAKGHLTARTGTNMIVDIEASNENIGGFADVKITGFKRGALIGTL